MEPDRTAVPDVVGYAQALDELTSILDQLEDDTIDIDLLAERVERAAELITICRNRIDKARLKVEQIVAELEDDEEEADV
ncbi:MAG: hypothetical protein JJLCMIEE_03595 [Acidimicrobiales bacterium]|nr:MAG: exodeoxyribonuclease VII small subunit [Actinomycetota bacterium]MBV6510447.1 hypothetical protein [Acidimicrobiales bacterium]RIK03749.1 MAG: exodeoxyribonuclease VII small subunit [Acidobacteriota bacterium]